MSPQKIKQEEACVEEMLTGGQIELSDSPWSVGIQKGPGTPIRPFLFNFLFSVLG